MKRLENAMVHEHETKQLKMQLDIAEKYMVSFLPK